MGVLLVDTLDYGAGLSFPSIEKTRHALAFTDIDSGETLTTVTVNAKWTPNNYTLTFAYENGTVISSGGQTYEAATAYPSAEKEGHSLVNN